MLFVDASYTGIGFALAKIQNGKEVVIAYRHGRGLSHAEQNYLSTSEREALALVEGIKKFQPYTIISLLLLLIIALFVG